MFIKYRNDDKLREWQDRFEKDYYSMCDKYRKLNDLAETLTERIESLEVYVNRLEDIITELLLKQGLEAVDVPEHIELVKIKK